MHSERTCVEVPAEFQKKVALLFLCSGDSLIAKSEEVTANLCNPIGQLQRIANSLSESGNYEVYQLSRFPAQPFGCAGEIAQISIQDLTSQTTFSWRLKRKVLRIAQRMIGRSVYTNDDYLLRQFYSKLPAKRVMMAAEPEMISHLNHHAKLAGANSIFYAVPTLSPLEWRSENADRITQRFTWLRPVDMFAAQSRSQTNEAHATGIACTATIPMSVDLPPFNFDRTEREFILWCGDTQSISQPWVVLDLARRNHDLRFVMLLRKSDTNLEPSLFARAKSLENVELVTDPARLSANSLANYFAKSCAVINTALRGQAEHFPLFLYATYHGVPYAVLDSDFDEESARYNETLINCENSLDLMSNELRRVIADAVYAEGFARKAHQLLLRENSAEKQAQAATAAIAEVALLFTENGDN